MRKNNSLETIEQELDKLKKENHGQMTPEEQIQWEYLTGVSLDYSAVLTHSYNEVSKAIPYVERALEILAPYPLQDRVHFEILCHYELADLYTTVENKKAVDEVNKMIELHKQWNHLNTTFDRRFLDESHYYMAKYSQIIFMADLISKEEIKDYYQKYIQIANKKKVVKSTYETTARYYQTIGEYKKAIAYIDSATQTDHFQPVNLVPILNAKAGLYYKLNDYKNAYLTLKESNKNRRATNDRNANPLRRQQTGTGKEQTRQQKQTNRTDRYFYLITGSNRMEHLSANDGKTAEENALCTNDCARRSQKTKHESHRKREDENGFPQLYLS